jgi:hypothetical protein
MTWLKLLLNIFMMCHMCRDSHFLFFPILVLGVVYHVRFCLHLCRIGLQQLLKEKGVFLRVTDIAADEEVLIDKLFP